ncbi:initiator tRNA phosphoribosyl transferase-domain-containing protein [Chaetomium sp. MPI-CAGE-AT-0009]|nr:initiator tRNA phosphoribosyl transferase-domain-containing protein [Chaetomium sp. MPI-CAGE-AT-0009]
MPSLRELPFGLVLVVPLWGWAVLWWLSADAAPTLDQVIFPEQASQNFSRILGDIKRSNFITNRLASISHDAAFVEKVADALELPLVSNERCGSWYIDPARKAGSAYFKSTDGHTGQWKFSSRRLNLHLLELVGENDGCIIVDSTRRGKPSQITALLPSFLTTFHSLHLDPTPLRTAARHKPLRPLFITPNDDDNNLAAAAAALAHLRESGFSPVVCCTASRRAAAGEGAGDDTENWACGLTPGAEVAEGACVVRVVPGVTGREEWVCEFVLAYLRRPAAGEAGASEKKVVVVLCESGKDLSVGVALAIYCWCFDDTGNVRQDDKEVSFNKAAIRVRLGHIVTTLPEANPSRATLQSVNSFLMDWRK